MVLVGSAPVYEVVNPVLAGSLFFIAGLNRTLNVYRQNDAGGDYFDAGFLFGLSALFCHGFAVSLLLLVASVFYTRAANWREVSLPVVGFILPPSIFLVVLWLANLPLFEMHLGTASETPIGAHVLSYMLAVVGIAAITGIFGMLKTYGSSGNKAKNSRAVLLIFSIGVSATAGWVFAYEPETAYGLVMLTASWLLPWPFTGRSNRWVSLMAMALIIILMLGWLARIELF